MSKKQANKRTKTPVYVRGKHFLKVFDIAYTTGALLLSEWVVLLGKNIP